MSVRVCVRACVCVCWFVLQPEMNEVSEKGLQVIFGDFFSLVVFAGGHVNGPLTQKGLRIGRHVTQVVHHHEHLHHRFVRVE